MTRLTCAIVVALLFLSLTAPVQGKNYLLHSPKLWSPQEKEQYEKENPPAINEKELSEKKKEQVKKEKEQAEKLKEQVKKEKELAEKEKERVKKEKELVKKEKELAEKQKELLKEEREQVEKQNELAKKEKEQTEKQKKLVKKEKERAEKLKKHAEKEKERIKENQILVKDGVPYREVTVHMGDTLYDISRKYRKEGSSYAETLRFNDIENPDQIVSGDTIKVPLHREKKAKQLTLVKQSKPVAATAPTKRQKVIDADKPLREPSPLVVKQPDTASNNKELPPLLQPAAKAAINPHSTQLHPVPTMMVTPQEQTFPNNATSGQQLFEQAIKSYRAGDCQSAIQLFGRFIAEHTTSPLSADASLLIADCYLKLAGK